MKTKVIQSDSLRKACMYIQDRTLTHSLSLSSTSPDHVPLEDTPEQALDTTSGGADPAEAADADAASVSQRRQKMSSLKQQWKTFDPDVSRTSEQEVMRDGGQGQAKKLKKSLSYSDSGSGAHGFDTIQYNLAESLRLETMSIMDKLSEDDEILEVVIESPGQPEVERDIQEKLSPGCKDWDMGSDGSSSSTSVKNSFLGSTEMYNSNVKLPSKSGRKDIRRRTTEKNTISPENEPDSKVFRTIDKLKHKSREFLPTPVSIIIPKAKASKSTQASYEEIKAETGWVRPAVRVHKRKKYISVTDSHGKQSSFDDAFHNGSNLPKEPSSTDSAEETGRRCTDRNSRMPPRSDPPASDQDFRTWRDENQGQSISRWIQQNERAEQMSVDEEHVKGHFDVGTSPWWGQHLQRDHSGGAVITLGQGYGYIQGRKAENSILGLGATEGVVSSSERQKTSAEEGKCSTDGSGCHRGAEFSSRNLGTCSNSENSTSGNNTGGLGKIKPTSPRTHSSFSRSRSEPFPLAMGGFSLNEDCEAAWELRDDLSYAAAAHVLDWMQRAALVDHMRPERQSTVDTLDSGIENDRHYAPRYASPQFGAHNGHRRLQRRPYPWAMELDASLVRGSSPSLAQEDLGGHRRLARMPYPWEIELDPRLIRGSNSSLSTEGNQEDARVHLTLDVIEAAVHRTVCRILSGSSVASSSPRRRAPPIVSYSGASFSDSELSYSDSTFYQRRRMFRKTRAHKQLPPARSEVPPQFTPTLGRAPGMFETHRHRRHGNNPDLTETKSDGRYSPYSVTDIPCFELPNSTNAYNLDGQEIFAANDPKFPRCNSMEAKDLVLKFPDHQYLAFMHHQQQRKRSLQQIFRDDGQSIAGCVTESNLDDNRMFYVQQPGLKDNGNGRLSSSICLLGDGRRAEESKSTKTEAAERIEGKENKLSVTRTSSSHSEGSFGKAGDGLRPTIVIHKSPGRGAERATSSTSTDDSYCGFGITRVQRKDLMGQLKCFQNLALSKKASCSPDSSFDGRSPSSVDDLPGKVSPDFLTQCSDPFDENSLISPASSFVLGFFNEKDMSFFEGGDLSEEFVSDVGVAVSKKNQRLGLRRHRGNDILSSPVHANSALRDPRAVLCDGISNPSSPGGRSDGGSAGDKTGQCVAYGPGLYYGQVGSKNNFQVCSSVHLLFIYLF